MHSFIKNNTKQLRKEKTCLKFWAIRDPPSEASVPAAANFKAANIHCLGEFLLSMPSYEAFARVRLNRM